MTVLESDVNTRPDTPSSRLGHPVAEDLEKLILACLEKEVDARPDSAEALGAALGRCQDAGGWGQPEAKHHRGEAHYNDALFQDGNTVPNMREKAEQA